MAAASSLTAELETLQTRTTQTLQQIDENFSRANELAAELFPLAREFVKQLCVADSESKVWHDAFLEVAGIRQDGQPPQPSPTVSDAASAVLKTPAKGRAKGGDLDDSDVLGSDLSSVAPRTTGRQAPTGRDKLTLFSPPVSTPFLKAARTPGHVSGYERGGLVGADKEAAASVGSTPQPPRSMDGQAAIASTRADVADSDDDEPMSATDMEFAAGDAPSPDLASPEMPALSSRAAALLGALGPDPTAATDMAAAAHASLRRSRLIAAPALAAASSSAQQATAAPAAPSGSVSAAAPLSVPVSPPLPRTLAVGAPTVGGAMSSAELGVGDWDRPDEDELDVSDTADDNEELAGMIASLGSPRGMALSRHSLAITRQVPSGIDSAQGAAGITASPSLEELTASAVASNCRRSTRTAAGPTGLVGEMDGFDEDDDHDLEPAPLTMSSLGSFIDSAADPLRSSRFGASSRRKSVGVAKHAEEFSLKLFPALFHTGRAATELIAVWAVVSGGQEGSTASAFSAKGVMAAIGQQQDTSPSMAKTTAMLQMLASQGFLREFTSKGNRFWRLQGAD